MENHCSVCDKNYKTKITLNKHNREFHNIFSIDKSRRKDEKDHYSCQYCKKEYGFIQNRWRHEKKCKIEKELEEQQLLTLQKENEKLRNQLIQEKEEKDKHKAIITKLQNKILSGKRLDNKTFRAVNKVLIDRSYRNSQLPTTQQNHNTHSNNIMTNSNNVTNNINYQIFALGGEDLSNVLTMNQKQDILNSRLCSLEKIVEITHCGRLNQFKNIIITNLKDNFAYRYDENKGYFITVSKTDLLDDLVSHRVTDIEAIYDELKTANRIDDKTKTLIQKFLDKMDSNDEPFYDNETKYENFKSFKTDRIKIRLYNNQDKITKDIALLISDKDIPDVI